MPTTQNDATADSLPLSYSSPPPSGERIGQYRWMICALLFFGTTINYIDRQVIGILGPELRDKLHIDKTQFGWIGFWFGMSYAFGQVVSGALLDRIGTRVGYAVALFRW